MIQTALWLPKEMHEKLCAQGGERGLGKAIRKAIARGLTAPDQYCGACGAHAEHWTQTPENIRVETSNESAKP